MTGGVVQSSLRHLRPAYLRIDDDQFDEEGDTNFASGQLVVVRLFVAKTAVRKWQVAQLLHTSMDQDAWEVQWYNTADSGSLLEARYLPAWLKSDGKEAYAAPGKQKESWKPLTWTVYKRRFLTPSFQLKHRRLPANIKSILRAKFGDKYDSTAVMVDVTSGWMMV